VDVGIRELKARLSEFIEQAARGKIIRVTERGKPKAILGPLPGQVDLARGVEEGWIRPPQSSRSGGARRRNVAGATVADVLGEDRGE
jgi:prevent-host-death family protein